MLRRRSIRLRILVLVLVPVVALVGLYAVVLDLTLGSFLTLRQANSVQTQITRPVSNLQAQLTTERTLAMQYMADPGQGQLTPLLGQEHRTDGLVRIFLTAASSAAASGTSAAELRAINVWRADLASLSPLRTSVSNLGASRLNALTAYSSIISDGDIVTNQAILPLVTGTVGIQANDIIDMERSAQAFAEESDLLGTDLATRALPAPDHQLFSQLAVLRQEIFNQTLPGLDPAYQAYFSALIPASASAHLTAMESAVIAHGVTGNKLVNLQSWISTVRSYGAGLQAALLKSGNALQATAQAQARSIALRLILIGGLGLLAIIAAVAVAASVSGGLVRQLNDLRLSALDLSGHRLPSTIERLRAGEDIDVDAEVPELEPSPDEIGQVRRAFDTVQRSAIASAVDENRIRRGVNDVFRNLARRSQSLLTRQLQLLDAMERRIDDPEELADLFKIDHLTTRMRRHAEGLLIVAGDSSGRSWREPVPLVDVIRAAIAEVEDYTRIRVMSRCGAAVAGHAVADVIHLLAELLENATMFSPANTPVRVDGDMVARGLAVEIEDRGLGMSDEQLEEINRKLANPPLFDLSGSDQLGLYIAGQLARRHDIKVTLRSSAFGGTAAVILIPRALVVPGAGDADSLATSGVRELGGRPIPQLLAAVPSAENGSRSLAERASSQQSGSAGVGDTGAHRYEPASDASIAARVIDLMNSPAAAADTSAWSATGAGSGAPAAAEDAGAWSGTTASPGYPAPIGQDASPWPGATASPGYSTTPDSGLWSTAHASPGPESPSAPGQDASAWATANASPGYPPAPARDASPWSGATAGPGYPSPTAPATPTPAQDASAWAPASPSYPSPTGQDTSAWSGASITPGYPASAARDTSAWSGPTASPGHLAQDTGPWSAAHTSPGPQSPLTTNASPWSGASTGFGSHAASWPDSDAPALPTRRRAAQVPRSGGNGGSAGPPPSGPDSGPDQADPVELPTRVRQASLAPQLRDQFASAPPGQPDSTVEISPEAARNTMAALQKGWERGRSAPAMSSPQESHASAEQATDGDAADSREQRAEEGQ